MTTGLLGFLKLWDTASGRELYTRRLPKGVLSLAFRPDGKQIVFYCGSKDSTVMLWDAVKGEEIRAFETKSNVRDYLRLRSIGVYLGLEFVGFNPKGTQIVTVEDDYTDEEGNPITSLTPSDKKKIAYLVKLWDIGSGKLLNTFEGTSPVAFSPDGKSLYTNGTTQKPNIRIYDTMNGQLIGEIEGSGRGMGFNLGKNQFARFHDGIQICDIATGKELAQFISLSGEDTQLTSASRGLTVETQTASSTIDGEWLSIRLTVTTKPPLAATATLTCGSTTPSPALTASAPSSTTPMWCRRGYRAGPTPPQSQVLPFKMPPNLYRRK